MATACAFTTWSARALIVEHLCVLTPCKFRFSVKHFASCTSPSHGFCFDHNIGLLQARDIVAARATAIASSPRTPFDQSMGRKARVGVRWSDRAKEDLPKENQLYWKTNKGSSRGFLRAAQASKAEESDGCQNIQSNDDEEVKAH